VRQWLERLSTDVYLFGTDLPKYNIHDMHHPYSNRTIQNKYDVHVIVVLM